MRIKLQVGAFSSKRVEVTGGWRKLRNEELHSLYSSPSIIRMIKSRRMRWAGHVARTRRIRMHKGFWRERQKESSPLGRFSRRWEDNIKMYLREIGWGGVDWINLSEDRNQWMALVNTVMNLRIPFRKFLSS
jgi:hypothetical protein